MARPTVMTTETIRKLEAAFSYGCTDTEAALYAGIAVSTLYDYCRENPKFAERKETLKETPFLHARESIFKGLKDDPKFSLEFMKAKKKGEFAPRTELTGADGVPLDTGHDILKEIAEGIKNANADSKPAEPAEGSDG